MLDNFKVIVVSRTQKMTLDVSFNKILLSKDDIVNYAQNYGLVSMGSFRLP